METIHSKMNLLVRHNIFLRTNQIQDKRPSIWLLHGFGDSGLAYKEVFDSPIAAEFNCYVVDLPGFGVSPVQPNAISIKAQTDLLAEIIREETENQGRVSIVAHSLGGLIGTWVCKNLGERIQYYFNIEGNLTEADSYFSSKPLRFKTAQEFAKSFHDELFEKAKSQEQYKRYYSSVRFADPEGMRNWSMTSQEHTKVNTCGHEFMELTCKKIYIWGDVDTPKETQNFILENNIPNQLYKGVGHWHMVENAKQLYGDIHGMLAS